MKQYYKVSYKHSEGVYCSNIAHAESKADVEAHYNRYDCVDVSEAHGYDVTAAQRKGMPIIEVEQAAEPEQAKTNEQTKAGYEIKTNTEYNSTEVYFDGKPSESIRAALKEHKYRWHSVKKCWYGKLSADEITAIIDGNKPKELTVAATEGYLGATEYTGCNYGMLFGAELSKAIRQTLKDYGVKGCSVSCKTYSGGQSIYVTVKASEADYISLEEFKAAYNIDDLVGHGCRWYIDPETKTEKYRDAFFNLTGAEQATAIDYNAEVQYNRQRNSETSIYNGYKAKDYKAFSAPLVSKLEFIQKVLDSFNHDDSNSMVDYFDRHFYETIIVTAA